MKTFAGILLILSALTFLAGFPYVALVQIEGPGLVTDLDRAGAINTEVIEQKFPQYSKNLRGDLGKAMNYRHHQALKFFVTLGFVSTSVGAFALLRKKTE